MYPSHLPLCPGLDATHAAMGRGGEQGRGREGKGEGKASGSFHSYAHWHSHQALHTVTEETTHTGQHTYHTAVQWRTAPPHAGPLWLLPSVPPVCAGHGWSAWQLPPLPPGVGGVGEGHSVPHHMIAFML